MKNSLNFADFLLEYSQFDGIDKSLTEKGPEINHEAKHANYKLALHYAKNFLTNYSTAKGGYNSAQAAIVLDRTERKFSLTPAERLDLEVDIFDWENQDNAEMHESHEYRLSPRNMKNYIDRIWKSGRHHTKTYQEFHVPMQK